MSDLLDFEKITGLRDTLVDSLKQWGEFQEDGFYRSAPNVGPPSSPSFTNTGIVLQAFNESGNNHFAQGLADRLICFLEKRNYAPFPDEKTKENPHVMCNSLAIFSILDCYPVKVNEFRIICEWFLETQKKDGSWALLPEGKTKYPVFTAYALSALIQFYDCYNKVKDEDVEFHEKIKASIKSGMERLFENRSDSIKDKGLLLWPASLGDTDENQKISFYTSAMCMHIIAKAARIFKGEAWIEGREEQVRKTFLELVNGFNEKEGTEFEVGDIKIKIWDGIQVNEPRLNYPWDFFAPINLVTLLRFIDSDPSSDNYIFYKLIKYLTGWILDNQGTVTLNDEAIRHETIGINGTDNLNEVKTWSTAQAVIVLSRLIKKRYELAQLEHTVDEHDSLIEKIWNKINPSEISEKYGKIIMLILNTILIVIAGIAFLVLKDKVQSAWNNIQGKVWLAGIIFSIIISVIGINLGLRIRNLKEKLVRFICKIFGSIKIIKEIETLISNHRGLS